MENTSFNQVNSLEELNEKFVGVSLIIETWFDNYKGADEMEIIDFANEIKAREILNTAIEQYTNQKSL